jgi:hypothetical protein
MVARSIKRRQRRSQKSAWADSGPTPRLPITGRWKTHAPPIPSSSSLRSKQKRRRSLRSVVVCSSRPTAVSERKWPGRASAKCRCDGARCISASTRCGRVSACQPAHSGAPPASRRSSRSGRLSSRAASPKLRVRQDGFEAPFDRIEPVRRGRPARSRRRPKSRQQRRPRPFCSGSFRNTGPVDGPVLGSEVGRCSDTTLVLHSLAASYGHALTPWPRLLGVWQG